MLLHLQGTHLPKSMKLGMQAFPEVRTNRDGACEGGAANVTQFQKEEAEAGNSGRPGNRLGDSCAADLDPCPSLLSPLRA
jgi:hypothetical protein